jgi:quinol monooxygenase YgiN
MILVSAKAPIKPEARDEMIQAAIDVQNATRQEAGCISYTFHTQVEDPNVFFVFEKWESMAHLQAHFEQEHTKTFLAKVGNATSGDIELRWYEAPTENTM